MSKRRRREVLSLSGDAAVAAVIIAGVLLRPATVWLLVLGWIGLIGLAVSAVGSVVLIRNMNRQLRAIRRIAAAGVPELDPSAIDLNP